LRIRRSAAIDDVGAAEAFLAAVENEAGPVTARCASSKRTAQSASMLTIVQPWSVRR
jgi:hypothetical protein